MTRQKLVSDIISISAKVGDYGSLRYKTGKAVDFDKAESYSEKSQLMYSEILDMLYNVLDQVIEYVPFQEEGGE